MKLLFGLLFLAAAWAAQVGAPCVGFARFSGGSVHAVSGLPANLLIGAAVARADRVSFSDSGGLLARGGEIELVDAHAQVIASVASGEAAPLVNVDGLLTSAIAWLPSSHSILRWDGKTFVRMETSLTGEVTSLQFIEPEQARLLVSHADASVSSVTVSLQTGQVIDSQIVPGIAGRAFAQHSYILAADSKTLVVESTAGERRVLPLAASDLSIERMSSDWLHIFSTGSGRHWALHLTETDLQLSRIPTVRGVAQ